MFCFLFIRKAKAKAKTKAKSKTKMFILVLLEGRKKMRKSIKKKIIREIKNQYPELKFQERIALLELLRVVENGEMFCLPKTAEMGEKIATAMAIFEIGVKPCGCGDPQCMRNFPTGELWDLWLRVKQAEA